MRRSRITSTRFERSPSHVRLRRARKTSNDLTAAVADLGARLREVASRPTGVSQDQLERRLADVVAALEAQSSSNAVTAEVADEVASIQQAVAGLELRFAGVAGTEAVAGIQSTVAHIGSRVDELGTTLAEATKSLELRDGPSKDDIDAIARHERAAREELAARVNELAAVPRMDEHARAELAELRERVSGLADVLIRAVSSMSCASGSLNLQRCQARPAMWPSYVGRCRSSRSAPTRTARWPSCARRLRRSRMLPQRLDAVDELQRKVSELAARPTQAAELAELQAKFAELEARPTQEAAVDELRHRVAELAERVGNEDALTALEQALVERHEAEAAARGSLESQLGELRNDLHGLAELRVRLDALASEQHDNVRQGDLEELRHRLGAVDGRLDGLASTDWVASLEQAARDASHAVNERLEGLELRLVDADRTDRHRAASCARRRSQLTTRSASTRVSPSSARASMRRSAKALRKGLEHTVAPEALAQLAADLYARLAAVEAAGPTTRDALDELGMRLGATEQQAWALPEQLDDRFGRLHLELSSRIEGLSAAYDPAVAALHARLDELAGAQAGRARPACRASSTLLPLPTSASKGSRHGMRTTEPSATRSPCSRTGSTASWSWPRSAARPSSVRSGRVSRASASG